MSCYGGTGGTTTTAAGTGYFQLTYAIPNYPFGAKSFISEPLAYNSTAAAITTAVAAMGIPDITVTVTNTFSGSSKAITITITGINGDRLYHTAAQSTKWGIPHSLVDGSSVDVFTVQVADTMASTPQTGSSFSSASLTLDVYGLVSRAVDIEKGLVSVAYNT